jgi:hypothetical protein
MSTERMEPGGMVAMASGRKRWKNASRRTAATRRWRRRSSRVHGGGVACYLEKIVHRCLGLEISFSGSAGIGPAADVVASERRTFQAGAGGCTSPGDSNTTVTLSSSSLVMGCGRSFT